MKHFHFDEQFFVAISFAIFFTLAYSPAKKLILNALGKRSFKIKNEFDEAELLIINANKLLVKHQNLLNSTKEDVARKITSAKETAERIVIKAKAEVKAEIFDKKQAATRKNMLTQEMMLRVVAENSATKVFDRIRFLMKDKLSKDFDISEVDVEISKMIQP